jgi:hypothetical protein
MIAHGHGRHSDDIETFHIRPALKGRRHGGAQKNIPGNEHKGSNPLLFIFIPNFFNKSRYPGNTATSILPLSVLTLKGNRWPFRSLKKRMVTLTGALPAA